jgi:hypothetical protein
MLATGSSSFPFLGNLFFSPDALGGVEVQDFDSGQRILLFEPGRYEDLGYDFSLGAPTSLLLLNRISPEGDPVGGGYAILPTFLPPA